MKDKKVPLKDWTDRLSNYYEGSTVKRYYQQYKGSEAKLFELYLTNITKRQKTKQFKKKLQFILIKRTARAYYKSLNDGYAGVGKIKTIQNVKKAGGSYEIHKSGNDVLVKLFPHKDIKPTVLHIEFGDKEKQKFKKFFSELDYYFAYAKDDVDIIRLEDILKKYYQQVLKIKALKARINKKSIHDENKAIEELLQATRDLLYINNDELYRSLPSTLPIQSIKEITAETISKLVQLDIELHKTITYSNVLEDLRNI